MVQFGISLSSGRKKVLIDAEKFFFFLHYVSLWCSITSTGFIYFSSVFTCAAFDMLSALKSCIMLLKHSILSQQTVQYTFFDHQLPVIWPVELLFS